MQVTLLNPLRELELLQRRIERAFAAPRYGVSCSCGYPPIDLIDAGDKFVIQTPLPGMNREEIEISVEGQTVTLSGEKRLQLVEGAKYISRERCYGYFKKMIELPEAIKTEPEEVKAEYDDGILTVILPKRPVGPMTISIS